jgi:hypothetical protein
MRSRRAFSDFFFVAKNQTCLCETGRKASGFAAFLAEKVQKPEGMHPKKAFSFQVHYGHSKGATPQTGRSPKL